MSAPRAKKPTPTSIYWKGVRQARLGNFRKAEALLLHALAPRTPKEHRADCHNDLAYCTYRQGKRHAALRHYRKAAALKRRSPTIRFNLGSLLAELGRLPEAIRHLRVAAAFEPSNYEFQRYLAKCLDAADEPDEAADVLEAFLKVAPRARASDRKSAKKFLRWLELHRI